VTLCKAGSPDRECDRAEAGSQPVASLLAAGLWQGNLTTLQNNYYNADLALG